MTADEIIARLNLAPHPEGGWYRQTWVAEGAGRPAGTCIFFLLKAGERSHWHRVDAAEIWHFYAGAPILLRVAATAAGPAAARCLGADLFAGQMPQVIVPDAATGRPPKAAAPGASRAAPSPPVSASRGSIWRRMASTFPDPRTPAGPARDAPGRPGDSAATPLPGR